MILTAKLTNIETNIDDIKHDIIYLFEASRDKILKFLVN